MEENEEMSMNLELDEVLHLLGGIGPFQMIMVVLTGLIVFPTTMAILIPYFTQDTPAWTCISNSTICNLTGTHPMDSKTYKARCDMPRTEWKFTQPRDFSVVTQFDLYCDTEAYNYLAISMVFVSWGIGAPLLGWMADRFGRRRIALPSVIAVSFFGFIGAFSPNFKFYIVSRFLLGFFIPGSLVQIFVIFQEVVAPKHRPFAAALMNVGWALATIVLGVIAIFVRSWKTLTLIVFAPFSLSIFSYCFVMESMRWLHLNGKTDDVMKLLDRIAKLNNKKLPKIELVPLKNDQSNGLRHFLNLFRPMKIAVRSLIQGYTWIAFGLVYYGVSFAAGDLGGSKYRDFLLSVSCTLPAAFIEVYLPNRFGRKKSVIIPAMIAGVACIIVALIPARSGPDNQRSNLTTLRVIIGLVGKLGITVAFDIMYLWSSEIYPTVTRSAAIGYLQVTARIGSALAPWVAKWLQIFHVALPFSLMGGLSFIAGMLLLLLPETKNCKTADVLDDQFKPSQGNIDVLVGDNEKNSVI
eukprot:Seg97.16 transcript_id=Seg97.16/GoldUCD/mRNA.D3Y31 product="Solute carrier family 22 member 3" protein_id=Seg97.16/GoldUCD/D3Y31